MFLSIFDVHVQYAPVAGRVVLLRHTAGQFLNAIKAESAAHNENVLIGYESGEQPGEKVGVRLIAGLIARRIVPWVAEGDVVARGERASLIQFGSRCDLYLPLSAQIAVKIGDHVRGGETVVAVRG
jgi:phosphatidylserine decarboxylase